MAQNLMAEVIGRYKMIFENAVFRCLLDQDLRIMEGQRFNVFDLISHDLDPYR